MTGHRPRTKRIIEKLLILKKIKSFFKSNFGIANSNKKRRPDLIALNERGNPAPVQALLLPAFILQLLDL